jgi:ankyrin repeat protein
LNKTIGSQCELVVLSIEEIDRAGGDVQILKEALLQSDGASSTPTTTGQSARTTTPPSAPAQKQEPANPNASVLAQLNKTVIALKDFKDAFIEGNERKMDVAIDAVMAFNASGLSPQFQAAHKELWEAMIRAKIAKTNRTGNRIYDLQNATEKLQALTNVTNKYSSALEKERTRLQSGGSVSSTSTPTGQSARQTASASGSSPAQSSFRTIFEAASRGTVQDVEHHIKNGINVNVKNNAGNTPLHSAAAVNPDVAVVRYLIAQKADVKARNNDRKTPLDVANTDEKRSIIFEEITGFRKSSVPFESPGKDIFDAAGNGTVGDVEHHVNNGADVNAKDDNGNTPVHHAAAHNPNAEVLRYLIAQKADLNTLNKKYLRPMSYAHLPEKQAILRVNGGRE